MAYSILAEISREIPEPGCLGEQFGASRTTSQCENADGFMFTAYDCVVFEEELDDGRFEYTAQNLTSGAKLTLERRKNPVTHATVERLVRKLRDSKIAGLCRLEISGDTMVQLSKMKMVLSELFREILPEYGYSIRNKQIELAEQLLGAIAARKILIAEAAVGLGKTLVYIIVGALIKRGKINHTWSGGFFPGMSTVEWKRMPILISTSSIALQKSVIEYIKEVSKILTENRVFNTPLRVSLKKGRTNYVCAHNLHSYMSYERDPIIKEALTRLLGNRVIDLAEINGLTSYVKSKISVPVKCYKNCPYSKDCLYMAFRESANNNEFDFIVTNHNLLLMDAKLRAEGKRAVLPPVQMYVIDEAHQLSSAARSIYGTELSVETITEITKDLLSINFTPLSKNNRRVWREVRDAVNMLAKQLHFLNRQLFIKEEADDCDSFLNKIRAISDYLRKVLKNSHKLKVIRDERRKHKLISELERLSEAVNALSENKQIRWFECGRNEDTGLSLCGLPKQLNERIYEDLWKRGVPALLTSGTLSAGGGDFTAFKRTVGIVGLKRVIETTQPSPYEYQKNCLLYLSEKVVYSKQLKKAYINALTDEIERLIRAAHGHTAVLFTSYNVMGRVFGKLQKLGLPFPLFKLERSTSNAIEQFKKSGNGILFASGALWEGIDIPGDTLSMLIIVKLPFAAPNRINEYEQTLYPNFRTYLNNVLTPEMLVKLKQGFGRLIRTESDTGVVAILDNRAYIGKAYHKRIIHMLPDCQVTDSVDEVKDFYKMKKPLEYFE